MKPLKTDLSIYNRFNFERTPVAVNYCFFKPDGISKLDRPLGLCEMAKAAQEKGKPFYMTAEEEDCVGKRFLGMTAETRRNDGGWLGVNLGAFERPGVNLKLRTFIPNMEHGSVHYVAFSPMDKAIYEPDLMVFVCTPRQAEVLLRANTYSTGEMYEPRGTTVGMCASLLIYPYQSGKINYTITGLHWGMNGRRVYPDGLVIVSIPYQKLPIVTGNLKEMTWEAEPFRQTREDFIRWDADISRQTDEESRNF